VLWYPIERGSEVLHAWSELTRSGLPDQLTTLGRFLRLPPLPEIPAEIRGKSFVIIEAFHVGDPAGRCTSTLPRPVPPCRSGPSRPTGACAGSRRPSTQAT